MQTEEAPFAPPEEQFVSAEQQRHAVTFGMWIFLATEVLFFGGLLVIYSAYRIWYPQEFAIGSRHLDIFLGTLNTAILLTSSFFMAGAITAGEKLDRRTSATLLFFTSICGVAFLCVKGFEWYTAIHDGFWPGVRWVTYVPQPHGVKLFYSLYFALTGLHGLHVIIGITLVAATALRFSRMKTFAPNQNRLKLIGLYWHFVDIVWIFLYPLLYFIGRSS